MESPRVVLRLKPDMDQRKGRERTGKGENLAKGVLDLLFERVSREQRCVVG